MGRIAFEIYKTVKVKQNEEVDGEVKEVEKDIQVRFDFVAPLGSSYDLVNEALFELKEELSKQEEMKKQEDEKMKAEAEKVEAEKKAE
jgi:hypothetical protein